MPAWNDEFELPDWSNSISDIQDNFEYIKKKYGENIDKPSVQLYVNKLKIGSNLKSEMGIVLSF